MAAGIVDVWLLTVVCVSSSRDRCLIVSHQVCRAVTFNRKKLTVVERCRSNHCVNNSVNVFRFMQERKYACGEQPKIRILQHRMLLLTYQISSPDGSVCSTSVANSQCNKFTSTAFLPRGRVGLLSQVIAPQLGHTRAVT